jgi:hypothetical protein
VAVSGATENLLGDAELRALRAPGKADEKHRRLRRPELGARLADHFVGDGALEPLPGGDIDAEQLREHLEIHIDEVHTPTPVPITVNISDGREE